MSHKVQMQAMLQSVLDSVKAGMPLSQALGKHHDLFGDFYINMVRSGEASGQMSGVLNRLVEHMARQRALRDSVVSATIYPAILLGVAVLSLVAMLGFVVPQFEQLFNDMGDALPRSEEHTSELQSQSNLVCRLLLEKKKKQKNRAHLTA